MDEERRKYFNLVRQTIAKHGVMLQGVGAGEDGPQFVYTVGLIERAHPEVLVFGLPFPIAGSVLNEVAARVRNGFHFEAGAFVHGLIEGYPMQFRTIDDSSTHLTVANALYRDATQEPVEALQLHWPSTDGRWPWEDGGPEVPVLG